jgi:hypothetical protein
VHELGMIVDQLHRQPALFASHEAQLHTLLVCSAHAYLVYTPNCAGSVLITNPMHGRS